MNDHNSSKSENKNQITLDDIKKSVQELADIKSAKPQKNKLSVKEIFTEILMKLEPVNFVALAGGEYKLPQKHEVVLSIEKTLEALREQSFDLARKGDFIFVYNGVHWSEVDKDELKSFLSKAAERLGIYSLEARHYEYTEKLYKQFLKDAVFESPQEDSKKVLINFANGTFEIDGNTTRLREHRASDFLKYQLPFEYDKTAECPRFNSFLNQVLPEEELQDNVSEFFAHAFIKHLIFEKIGYFYGTGANGKSVVFRIVGAVFGRENITHFSLSDLMQENNRALIANKLLNYGSEINASITKDIFKNLASTEPIQARLKYGNSFIMENYAKLCFNCNELPRDIEHLRAYYRRLLIIPFRVTIPEKEQDNELAQKIIENELAGVFNWIQKGLYRLLENKRFTESKIAEAEIELYKKESDSAALFLEESNLVRHSTKTQLLKHIYPAYRDFCQEDGHKPLNKKNFSKRLQQNHGFLVEKRSSGMNVCCEYLQSDEENNFASPKSAF